MEKLSFCENSKKNLRGGGWVGEGGVGGRGGVRSGVGWRRWG